MKYIFIFLYAAFFYGLEQGMYLGLHNHFFIPSFFLLLTLTTLVLGNEKFSFAFILIFGVLADFSYGLSLGANTLSFFLLYWFFRWYLKKINVWDIGIKSVFIFTAVSSIFHISFIFIYNFLINWLGFMEINFIFFPTTGQLISKIASNCVFYPLAQICQNFFENFLISYKSKI